MFQTLFVSIIVILISIIVMIIGSGSAERDADL